MDHPLLRHLDENEQTLWQGLSIMVMGNGRSVAGSGLGPVVDDHDVVVRMNLAEIEGHQHDAGWKTQIMCVCPEGHGGRANLAKAGKPRHQRLAAQIDELWFSRPGHISRKCLPFPKIVEHLNTASRPIRHPRAELYRQLIQWCRPNAPSTGLVTLAMVLRHAENCRVNIAGYDHGGMHYYDNTKFWHNPRAEKRLVDALVETGRVTRLSSMAPPYEQHH